MTKNLWFFRKFGNELPWLANDSEFEYECQVLAFSDRYTGTLLEISNLIIQLNESKSTQSNS